MQNDHRADDENSTPYTCRTYRTLVIGGSSKSANTSFLSTTSNLRHLETLDQMEAHRKFHAAESGQLQPRTRHSSNTSVSSNRSQPVSSAREEQQASRAVSWPVTNNEIVLNMTVPHNKPIRKASPHVVPFRAFVEMHPPPKACPSAWTEKTQDRMEEKIQRAKRFSNYTVTNSKHSRSSSTNSSLSTPETPLSSDNISIYSRVTRKVNDGFELLPAGTLDKPTPVKDFDDANHRILFQYPNDRIQAKRLQKR